MSTDGTTLTMAVTGSCVHGHAEQAVVAIGGALYSHDSGPGLEQALREPEQEGTGNMLLAHAEQGQQGMNQDAFTAATCADTSKRYTVQEVEVLLPELVAIVTPTQQTANRALSGARAPVERGGPTEVLAV